MVSRFLIWTPFNRAIIDTNEISNVIDGKYDDVAQVEEVIYGTDFKQSDKITPKDWAIMKINQPLGRKYGHLGWKSISTATLVKNPKSLFFVGYSGDFPTQKYQKYFSAGPGFTASYEAGCSIVDEDEGFLLHDCATAGGSCLRIVGKTPTGHATVVALHLSSDADALEVRSYWVLAGWHPPQD